MAIEITQPELRCRECGERIPDNGYQYDDLGKPILDKDGYHVWNQKSEMICKQCALKKREPERKVTYHPNNELQEKITGPTIYVR